MFQLERKRTIKELSIIIVGCGKVGDTLVQRLTKEGHNITVIDQDADKVSAIMNDYDVMGVVGNGGSYTVQMEAGIEQADVLIAVTGSDELNLLCCVIAEQVGNCEVIARVRTPDYSSENQYLQKALGLAMIINPEKETADAIARILYLPNALEVLPFARGRAEMVRIKLPRGSILENKTIAELSVELTGAVLICAVERDGSVVIPSGSYRLHAEDVISFISPLKECKQFLRRLGFQTRHVKNALIIGGSRAAYYLAKHLGSTNVGCTLVEESHDRCEELSLALPKTIVINGSGTDEDLLRELGMEQAESFIALTGLDEENILLSMYAKKVSNAKTITKINRINFDAVIDHLDLGSVIYPKYITTEKIVAFIRAKSASMDCSIETIRYLFDDRVEAIEFKIETESAVTNRSLMELKLKDQVLVACINRGNQIMIPCGKDVILPGDVVIIVTSHTGFTDILDIIK